MPLQKACTAVLLAFLTGFTFANQVTTAPVLSPFAFVAKQVAPGTSFTFEYSSLYGMCDSCKVDDEIVDGELKAITFLRIDLSPLSFTWPRTQNTAGAYDWKGHTFGGGIFLNFHYAIPLEFGVSPVLVQWAGPIYLGASYDFSFVKYFGQKGNETNYDWSDQMFAGAANFVAGAMMFMNYHGFGFGGHGGLRQVHIASAGCTRKDYGDRGCPVEGLKFHIDDWVFYYGVDIITFSSVPLLKETRSKSHSGFALTFEAGIRKDGGPLFWALNWSIFL